MGAMKNSLKIVPGFLFAVLIPLALVACPAHVDARSIFEGLELVESSNGGGVEIVSVEESSPAEKARLQVGDRIVKIGKYGIRSLDDYVKVSRAFRDRKAEVAIEYRREGALKTATLSLYSSSLRKRWGLDVIPRRKAGAAGREGGSARWRSEARARISRIENKDRSARSPEEYGEVIKTLYTSLDEEPDSLGTASLIGRQYTELAALYYSRGKGEKAAWCLKRALQLHANSLRKAKSVGEMASIKEDLSGMQETISTMR